MKATALFDTRSVIVRRIDLWWLPAWILAFSH